MRPRSSETGHVNAERSGTTRNRSRSANRANGGRGRGGRVAGDACDYVAPDGDELQRRLERGTGYAGEYDEWDYDEWDWKFDEYEYECSWGSANARCALPSCGPDSDSLPGDNDDEDKESRRPEDRPGTIRQAWWRRPYGDVGISLYW